MDGPGDGDTRRVEGESCEAVVEVLSLTAALALTAQPPRVTPPPPPARVAPPRPAPSTSSSSSASTSSSPSSRSLRKRRPSCRKRRRPKRRNPRCADKTPVIVTPPASPTEHVRRTGFQLGLQAVAANVITDSSIWAAASPPAWSATSMTVRARQSRSPSFTSPTISCSPPIESRSAGRRWRSRVPPMEPRPDIHLAGMRAGDRRLALGDGPGHHESRDLRGRSWWSAGALVRTGAQLGGGYALELEAGVTIPSSSIASSPRRPSGQWAKPPQLLQSSYSASRAHFEIFYGGRRPPR